jgi:hypothetical protein
MMPNDQRADAVTRGLESLEAHDVDAARAARIRARCHAVLARRRRAPRLAAFVAGPLVERVLEPAIVGGLGAVYLTEVLRRALALYGF